MSKLTVFISLLLGGFVFTSCASAPLPSNQASTANQEKAAAPASDAADTTQQKAVDTKVPRSRPQLIKKASISLIVNSVDKSIDAVSQLINKQQGDLIGLKEQQPTKDYGRHTASITLRIPQNLLEPTLDELGKLGTVKSRNITADDVSNQLVDFQARLTNLRKTETNLQKIMDRAGSVRDVLNVAQELSNIRQAIEQIDAQLKNLQNQVAYSTITLNLEAAVSGASPQRGLNSQVQETWNNSTNSFGGFTVGLLKLGIWLMVYSPYLLVLVAGIYGLNRWRSHAQVLRTQPVSPTQELDHLE
jgi:DNA repair ATPase RecN